MILEGVRPTPAIFPAIDLRGGRTVRLVRGERGAQIDYGDDPVAAARRWVEAGAEWIHAIDLGAAFGEADNRAAIAAIARAVPVPVQAGGGLRDDRDIDHLLGEGVARVILGTRALRDPEFLRRILARHGAGRVVLAMDLAGGKVRVKGWEEESGLDLAGGLDLARRAGVEHVLLTAIDRDGTLSGPDLQLVRSALEAGTASVVAAGGIGRIEDVRALLEIHHPRLEGVVVGRALYEGTVSLSEAVALSRKYRAVSKADRTVSQEYPHVSSIPPKQDLRQDRAAASGEGGLDAVLDGVKYDANGLVPAVVQDAADGQVLMVAYMNREALRRTITSGATCFWSRSRQEYWVKGATSGNTQKVARVLIDCDADCVLVVVEQTGVACHTGMRSCFYRQAGAEGLREIDTSGPIYRR